MKTKIVGYCRISFYRSHNLEVPGSSPGWSTLKIKHLREIASAFFFFCVNKRFELAGGSGNPLAKIEEIQHTALLLFAGYLDAATSMAASSGGGGSDTGGWGRDKDEDDLEWARRCARMANSMCKRRKGLHR